MEARLAGGGSNQRDSRKKEAGRTRDGRQGIHREMKRGERDDRRWRDEGDVREQIKREGKEKRAEEKDRMAYCAAAAC
jgi:hypothetical protein